MPAAPSLVFHLLNPDLAYRGLLHAVMHVPLTDEIDDAVGAQLREDVVLHVHERETPFFPSPASSAAMLSPAVKSTSAMAAKSKIIRDRDGTSAASSRTSSTKTSTFA